MLAPSVSLVIVAGALVAVFTIHDSHIQLKSSQEQAWRLTLKSDTEFPGAMLDGFDLRGLYASAIDLSGASLQNTDLRGATLNNARFDGSDLAGANLDDAGLESASFYNASLSHSSIKNARMAYTDLRGADLRGTDLSDTDLFMADVRGVDLSHTKLTNESVSFICSSDQTIWPRGIAPRASLCQGTDAAPAMAASWTASAYVTQFGPEGDTAGLVSETNGADGNLRLLVRFANTGRTMLSNINVDVDLKEHDGVSWVAKKALLFNGNYPLGYEFTGNWLQDAASRVNVGIGDYGPNLAGVAYLIVDIAPTKASGTTCGDHVLVSDVYVGPEGGGMVKIGTSTNYHVTSDCQ